MAQGSIKSSEILHQYLQGRRNFQGLDLSGQCFQRENLAGADFSKCNLRGTNFKGASLQDTKFNYAVMGLTKKSQIGLLLVLFLMANFSGILIAAFTGLVSGYFIDNQTTSSFGGLILAVAAIAWAIPTLQTSLSRGIITSLASTIFLTTVVDLLSSSASILLIGSLIVGGLIVITELIVPLVIIALGTTAMIAGKLVSMLFLFSALIIAVPALQIIYQDGERITLFLGASLLILTLIAVAGHLSWQIIRGSRENIWLFTFSNYLAAWGGTKFNNANLTKADFTGALLNSTDFRRANVTHTCWQNSQKLDNALTNKTILTSKAVRNLLVKGANNQQINLNLEGINLEGANLRRVNLVGANLREANLNQAILQGANLEGANLSKIQAIGANFKYANLTGACLDSWNINTTTILDDVYCEWVYLQEIEIPGSTQWGERRPNSGIFPPGGFTKLFQQIVDTIDLIFWSGVNWQALSATLQQIRVVNQDYPLQIQSIENKSDGVVVIKVTVPSDCDKASLHQQLEQIYRQKMEALEARYQKALEAREQLIETYGQKLAQGAKIQRQQNTKMEYILELLSKKVENIPVNLHELKAIANLPKIPRKLVILTLLGSFEEGFPYVSAQFFRGLPGQTEIGQVSGSLTPATDLLAIYQQWRSWYQSIAARASFYPVQTTNISLKEVYNSLTNLKSRLNQWLITNQFAAIDKGLREQFSLTDEIQIIVQSDNQWVRRFPWHLWDFFDAYRQAEVGISVLDYQKPNNITINRRHQRILVILGNSQGINLEQDRSLLASIPDTEVVFWISFEGNSVNELFDLLWSEQGWDIICFAGHSSSEADLSTGAIHLTQDYRLTIEQLKNSLTIAIERGLQLAIFNSCDGLGLAKQLQNLRIPQIIVMREPVPDFVAQQFLKKFLINFAGGLSLYLAVRQAREQLECLEEQFPGVTLLPVICHNPATDVISWKKLAHPS